MFFLFFFSCFVVCLVCVLLLMFLFFFFIIKRKCFWVFLMGRKEVWLVLILVFLKMCWNLNSFKVLMDSNCGEWGKGWYIWLRYICGVLKMKLGLLISTVVLICFRWIVMESLIFVFLYMEIILIFGLKIWK